METETEMQTEMAVERVGMPTPLEVEMDSQKAIARIAAIAKVIEGCAKVSIQRTNPRDWVRMRHKDKESFYLQASGAQKVRAIWGIYYRDRHVTKETNPDGTYAYIVTGAVGSKVLDQLYGEVVIEIDGGRSSGDSFFTGKDGNSVPDPMDVRKAALANWEARAVTALLGLRNMSAEDLQKNGIDLAKVAGFEFENGAQGGGQVQFISQAQGRRLWAICNKNGVTEEMLKLYLQENYNISSGSQILRTDYESICNWAQKGESRKAG